VVGGRIGADQELGFLRGDGDLSDDGRLTLTTMDPRAVPAVGDSVLTWGSQGGRPYVSGVPIGTVQSVEASPRDQTATRSSPPRWTSPPSTWCRSSSAQRRPPASQAAHVRGRGTDMPVLRASITAAVIVLAVCLQVGLLADVSVAGVVPDLVLLVVVGVALVHGPSRAAVVGLLAGLTLDLAPPADHTAGRWALALVLVGYLAGLVRSDAAGALSPPSSRSQRARSSVRRCSR
jgi:hypothetical protein